MQNSQDMALVENLAAIAQRAERYVYSTDPDRTRNPGYHPVQLTAGMSLQMIPFPRYLFDGQKNGEIKVLQDLEACEPGEEITITLCPPEGSKPTDLDAKSLCAQITSRSFRSTSNKGRLIIQDNISEEKR